MNNNNTATLENPVIKDAATLIEDATNKSEARIKIGKVTYDVDTLQGLINTTQSQAGRLKATDEAKAASKSVRELDGGEVSYIPVSAVAALVKAKKLSPQAANKIRALDMIQRGLAILSEA